MEIEAAYRPADEATTAVAKANKVVNVLFGSADSFLSVLAGARSATDDVRARIDAESADEGVTEWLMTRLVELFKEEIAGTASHTLPGAPQPTTTAELAIEWEEWGAVWAHVATLDRGTAQDFVTYVHLLRGAMFLEVNGDFEVHTSAEGLACIRKVPASSGGGSSSSSSSSAARTGTTATETLRGMNFY